MESLILNLSKEEDNFHKTYLRLWNKDAKMPKSKKVDEMYIGLCD